VASRIQIVIDAKDRASGTIKGVNQSLEKLGGIAIKAGAAVGAAFVGLGAAAVKLAADAEGIAGVGAAFEGISADISGGADAMLAALKKSSGGLITNTELMKQFNLAAQLVSVDFAQQLPDAMQHLGKVAAATGQDMDFLLNSLTVGVGRMSPMILDNLGIQVDLTAANEAYAASLGKSVSELTKAEQQTALTNQVMEKLAANTAKMPDVARPFATLQTTLANLKDEIGLRLLPVMAPLFEQLGALATRIAPLVVSAFERIAPALTSIIELFAELLAGSPEDLWGDIANAAYYVAEALGATKEQAVGVFNRVRELGDWLGVLRAKVADLIRPIAKFVTEFVSLKDVLIAVGAGIATVALPALVGLVSTIGTVAAPILGIIAAVALLRNAWERNWGGIQDTVGNVLDRLRPVAQAIGDLFKNLFGEREDVWGDVADVVWRIAQALGATEEGAAQAWQQVRNLQDGFSALFSGDFSTAGAMFGEVAVSIRNAIAGALSNLWAIVQPQLTNLYTAITAWFAAVNWSGIWQSFKMSAANVGGALWEQLSGALMRTQANITAWAAGVDWRGLWQPFLASVANLGQRAGQFVAEGLTTIYQRMTEFFANTDWRTLGEKVAIGIKNGLLTLVSAIGGILTTVWTFISNFFSNGQWQEAAIAAVQLIVAGFMALWQFLSGVFGQLWSDIKGWFQSQDWAALGRNIIDGIVRGIKSGAGAVKDALLGMAQNAWDAVKDFFKEGSPSRLAMETGRNVGEGLALGIASMNRQVTGAAMQLAAAAMPQLGTPNMALVGAAAGANYQRTGASSTNNVRVDRIVINGAQDPVAVGREVERAIYGDSLRSSYRRRGY